MLLQQRDRLVRPAGSSGKRLGQEDGAELVGRAEERIEDDRQDLLVPAHRRDDGAKTGGLTYDEIVAELRDRAPRKHKPAT